MDMRLANGQKKIKECFNKNKIGFLLIQALQILIIVIFFNLYSSVAEEKQDSNSKNYILILPFSIN